MDNSGNNRYELLFMDEDTGSAPQAQTESAAPKKKQPSTVGASTAKKASTAATNKKAPNAEKENKSGTLNKNDMVTKKATGAPDVGQGKVKQGTTRATVNNTRSAGGEGGDARRVAFKSQNGEVREQRNNRRNFREGGSQQGVEFANEQREPRQFRDRENRGPPRNREGVYRGGKREFDRQSGSDKTGVKAVDKRDGAGAHNWGSVKEEIDDINKSNTTTDADATLTDKDESSNEQSAEQPAVPEEEEVKELTLDEWKALRGERSKPQYNIRKANEGEDTSQWKQMVVLTKKKDGDSEEEFEYDPSMYPQRVGRLQRIVDIQFNFNDGRRGGGAGGGGFGRGRGRGPRPGGDNKGPRPESGPPRQQRSFGGERQQKRGPSNALKVDDERQFPTLS